MIRLDETAQQAHRRLRRDMRAVLAAGPPWPAHTREQIALHEAGHAVLATALGLTVDRIDIGSHGGYTAFAVGSRVAPLGAAAISWAGVIATDEWVGGDVDLAKIRALSPEYLTSAAPDSPFELARGVLIERWAEVERLAAELAQ